MNGREKLTESRGVRFSPSLLRRLTAKEPTADVGEFARRAVEAEVGRLEEADDLLQIARLREAGIDLKALVELALAKKALEDAQAKLPGFFNQGGSRE